VGERVRVYRATGRRAGLLPGTRTTATGGTFGDADPRDYDGEHYVRVLRETYAARLERAFAPGDAAALFGDPTQLDLFARPASRIRPVLRPAP
jgi:DNA polymerase I